MRKGILLAGGTGTRLYPLTMAVNKHLLPVYNKPMIYYSLSVLMLAGVRDILLISTRESVLEFEKLLGDGSQLGISIGYAVQDAPNGIAEAFIVGEEFIDNSSIVLILGDNIFFGVGLGTRLRQVKDDGNATVLCHEVQDPQRYGVVALNKDGEIIEIEEKPTVPRSNFAVTGLYFYPGDVAKLAKSLSPSARGELEITDLNNLYLKQGRLKMENLSRGYAWLDAGTESALLDSANFIASIEKRQSLRIGCIEEVAWAMGWIDKAQVIALADQNSNSSYGAYLRSIIRDKS